MSKFKKQSQKTGIVWICCTRNNTVITLTTPQGQVLLCRSAGYLGFKNSRKSTSYAALAVAQSVVTQAVVLGIESVSVYLVGLGAGKYAAAKTFSKSRIRVSAFVEKTPQAHNGCRACKKRRL